MNKLAKVAMLASVLALPFAANAAPADGNYSGPVTVKKGLTLSCTLTATVSGGGTVVSNIALSGPFCGAVSFNNQPYSGTSTGTTSGNFTITSVDVNTITSGDCIGPVAGTYVNSGTTRTVTLNARVASGTAIPPEDPTTQPCEIWGTISRVN